MYPLFRVGPQHSEPDIQAGRAGVGLSISRAAGVLDGWKTSRLGATHHLRPGFPGAFIGEAHCGFVPLLQEGVRKRVVSS